MTTSATVDAVVIGSGPNGLVAAIALARAGWDVLVLERASVPGGAIRSEELTLPGFVHDRFSAFYGILHASPAFDELGLGARVAWRHAPAPYGAALAPGDAAVIATTADDTARSLGSDGDAWRALFAWWIDRGSDVFQATLRPVGALKPTLRAARAAGLHPFGTARMMLASIDDVARRRLRTERARELIRCSVAHSDVSPGERGSTPLGLFMAMVAQERGMAIPAGGSSALARALVTLLEEAGGSVRCDENVTRVIVERGRAIGVETASGFSVRARRAVVADTGPLALFRDLVGEEHVSARFRKGLRRFRYGTGMFRIDLALDAQAPWSDEALASVGVVHLTGGTETMARATAQAHAGVLPERPTLIIGQQSIADPSRAPAGKHTLWIETHAPPSPVSDGERALNGWADAREVFTERALDVIEAHAPGLRARILGMFVQTPQDLQASNPNLVGGDPGGGSSALDMQLVFRPVPGWFRYRMPVTGLYMCSASTHPGGGVHGMCGWNCAARVLADAR